MIKHIYADGDSFIFGQELGPPPVTHADFYVHTEYMKKYGFVGLVRDHFGIEGYTNLATPGGSNDRMFRQTIPEVIKLLEKYEPPEIFVIIGWTQLSRRDFYCSSESQYYIHLNNLIPNRSPYKELAKIYTGFFDDRIEHAARFAAQFMGLQSFLKAHKIPYLFSNTLADALGWDEYRDFFDEPFMRHVDHKRYLGFPFCHYINLLSEPVKFGPAHHPLEDGHRIWANKIIEFIDTNKLLEQP